jgi:hypothetical protein
MFHNNQDYRTLWGGGKLPELDRSKPCKFRGEDVRDERGRPVTRSCPGYG